jgi:uncharacterized protein (TIGR02996 family)
MSDDAAFLRAIADAPTDDAPRPVYADWLEEKEDSRAEFLRLEVSLRQPTTDRAVYRALCKREQALVRRLDSVWVQRVCRYTTPPSCRDIARLVPELAPLARTTIRLHPRRLVGELEAGASKVGLIGELKLCGVASHWELSPQQIAQIGSRLERAFEEALRSKS